VLCGGNANAKVAAGNFWVAESNLHRRYMLSVVQRSDVGLSKHKEVGLNNEQRMNVVRRIRDRPA
jgi:hypothetical protein